MKIVFAGTPEFAAVALAALIDSQHDIVAVYTQPDRPAGRGRKLAASPVKQLALEHGITVEQPLNFKNQTDRDTLSAYQADVMVVAAYGLILPVPVLNTPRRGCLNIHASLLPRWRGAAPIQRAILAGDSATGITIMQMDAGLDTGDILLKRETPIMQEDTAASLHDRLADLGAQAIQEALLLLEQDRQQPEKQDEQLATYAKKISKQEASINWQDSAEQIHRQIRAFYPWPVAQTRYNDKVIRIHRAEMIRQATQAKAGEIVRYNKEGLWVACGEDQLCITQAQLPGARAMSIVDIYNGHPQLFEIGSDLNSEIPE